MPRDAPPAGAPSIHVTADRAQSLRRRAGLDAGSVVVLPDRDWAPEGGAATALEAVVR